MEIIEIIVEEFLPLLIILVEKKVLAICLLLVRLKTLFAYFIFLITKQNV